MKSLSKKFRRLLRNNVRSLTSRSDNEEVLRTADDGEVQGQDAALNKSVRVEGQELLGQSMFCVSTRDKTMVLFMGAEPLSYSLALLMAHTPAICNVIRNMAYWLSEVYHKDSGLLIKVASHGGIQPEKTPFTPVGDPPYNLFTSFFGEFSYYEVAQMCMVAIDSYKEQELVMQSDPKFGIAYEFFNNIWNQLPDTVKMSALQTGDGGKVAH